MNHACPEHSRRVRADTFPFPPRVLARLKSPPSKSFISPAYDRPTRNSFVSPAYTKTGGCTPKKMSARRHLLSLFSHSPLLDLFPSIACTLFHFPYHTYPLSLQHLPHSLPKNRGYSPLRSYQCFRRSLSFVKKPLLCVPSQRTLRLCGESLFSLPATSHFLPLPFTIHFRGQTNVTAAGGRSVLQRCFSLRGAAASISASNGWAWSKGRERRKRSARRAWAYFS
jgi:hypothetical protein